MAAENSGGKYRYIRWTNNSEMTMADTAFHHGLIDCLFFFGNVVGFLGLKKVL